MRYALSSFFIALSVAGQGIAAETPVATYVVAPEIEGCIEGWEMPVRVTLEPTSLDDLNTYRFRPVDMDQVPLGARIAVPEADSDERSYIRLRRGLEVTDIEVPTPERVTTAAEPRADSASEPSRAVKEAAEENEKFFRVLHDLSEKTDLIQSLSSALSFELDICTSPMGTRLVDGSWHLAGSSNQYSLDLEGMVKQVSEIPDARAGTLSVVIDQDEATSIKVVLRTAELPFENLVSDEDEMLAELYVGGQISVDPDASSVNSLPSPVQSATIEMPARPFARSASLIEIVNELRDLSAHDGPQTGKYVLQTEPNEECDPATEYPMLTRIENFQVQPRLVGYRDERVINRIERARINDFWEAMTLSVDAEISGCFRFGVFRLTQTAIVLKGKAPGHKVDYHTQWKGPFNGHERAQQFYPRFESRATFNGVVDVMGPYSLVVNRLKSLSVPVLDTVGPKMLRPRPVDLNFSFVLMPDSSLTPQLLQEVIQ